MHRLRWILLFSASLLFLLLLFLFLFRSSLLQALGEYLVTDDPLEEVDLIVILQGSIPDRILHGIALYQGGFGKEILMVRSHDFSCYQLMEEYQLRLPGHVDLNYQVAIEQGVAPDDIIILPGQADSTFDEALIIRDYLARERKASLLLITSKYHATRSLKIFNHVVGDDIVIISSPSPYDPFDSALWWQERRMARSLLLEYLKLMNFYLFQRRSPWYDEESMGEHGGDVSGWRQWSVSIPIPTASPGAAHMPTRVL